MLLDGGLYTPALVRTDHVCACIWWFLLICPELEGPVRLDSTPNSLSPHIQSFSYITDLARKLWWVVTYCEAIATGIATGYMTMYVAIRNTIIR